MFLTYVIFIGLLAFAQTQAQQTFESKGQNYHAKVTIQRNPHHYNKPPFGGGSSYANAHPRPFQQPHRMGPWKQGDRITKQEVIQNVAKALLHRKQSAMMREELQRKKNEETLKEYVALQTKLARMQKESQLNQAQPQQMPPVQSNQLQDSWRPRGGAAVQRKL